MSLQIMFETNSDMFSLVSITSSFLESLNFLLILQHCFSCQTKDWLVCVISCVSASRFHMMLQLCEISHQPSVCSYIFAVLSLDKYVCKYVEAGGATQVNDFTITCIVI